VERVVAIATFYLQVIFSFALMQKKQKIKPENKELENDFNYLPDCQWQSSF
jgi:hypothetical protein